MNTQKFKNIVQQYEKLVFTICYQFVHDYYEAQNLAQETFISAYKHIDSCDPEKYKPWISRIATNKAKDYLKSAYVRRVQLTQTGEENNDVVSFKLIPEDDIIEKESVERIKEIIYSLKEPYLKVSVMFFIEEKKAEEIAYILKRPEKTVRTQVMRARNILKKVIEEGM